MASSFVLVEKFDEVGQRRVKARLTVKGFQDPDLVSLIQAGDTQSRIDQHIPVAATDVPDVAADQRVHIGLPDQRDVIIDTPAFKPSLCDSHEHSYPIARGR